MQRTILIVEDENILREFMKDYLLNEGYNALEETDGKEVLSIFEEHEVHLIILDIMLPELDGWAVCRRIRKKSNVPIIKLTARVDEDDTLLRFELGADDYVTKPYSPPILLTRTKRLTESRYSTTVNTTNESNEEILTCLMQNQGMVITREQLIIKILGYEFVEDNRTVNSYICNLRQKLRQEATCIVTVVRTGYTIEGQV